MDDRKPIELKNGRTAIGGRRPPNHVVNEKVDMVHRMMVEGWKPHQINKYFKDKEDRSPRTVENWIQAAHEYNRELYARDREHRTIEMASKLDHVYMLSIKAKEYNNAINAIKTKMDLFGDKGAIRIEHQIMPEVPTRIVVKVDNDVK